MEKLWDPSDEGILLQPFLWIRPVYALIKFKAILFQTANYGQFSLI